MMLRVLFPALLILQQPAGPSLNAEWGAILPADYFPPNMYGWCSREAPARTGYWTPGPETIGSLETVLAPALQVALDKKSKDPSRRRAASDYYRQYIGLRVRGRQVVYVNGFHKSYLEGLSGMRRELADWRTRAVNVCDGGSMFFGAEYDPATRQVANIRFNGPG
jgi:hypothetical protein